MFSFSTHGFAAAERFFLAFPEKTKLAARMSVNDTAQRFALRRSREEMRDQVNFPAGYLEQQNRLSVTKKARNDDLEAIITGRTRATSLARFAAGTPASTRRAGGVRVRVDADGGGRRIGNAFLLRLRRGASLTEDNYNLGLAIRLRPGERVASKSVMARSFNASGGLYLLYGPSIDQVFRTVAEDIAPEVAVELGLEFTRQLRRLLGGDAL